MFKSPKMPSFTVTLFSTLARKNYCLSKRFQNFSIEPKYTSEICRSPKISYRIDFKNDEYDFFWKFKTTFCKNYLIPVETETRNVYSRVCGIKKGNYCPSVFFLCWPVF